MASDATTARTEEVCVNNTDAETAASLFECAYSTVEPTRETSADGASAGVSSIETAAAGQANDATGGARMSEAERAYHEFHAFLQARGRSTSDRQAENLPELQVRVSTPRDKEAEDLYQNRMIAQLQTFSTPSPSREGESAEQTRVRNAEEITQRKQLINEEMQRGEFGPASQAAFKEYMNWIGKKILPHVLNELESRNLPALTDSPFHIQTRDGRRLTANETITGALTNNNDLPFERMGERPPTLADAQRIEDAINWVSRATDTIIEADQKAQDERIERTIRERGLPAGWLHQEGQDKTDWRAAANKMIQLALSVGAQVNLIDKLDLKIPMPAGTNVENLGRNQTAINLNLPQTLDLNSAANAPKIKALEDWQAAVQKQMSEVNQRLSEINQNPRNVITWGDAPISGNIDEAGMEVWSRVRLGADNRMIGLVNPDKPELRENERTEAVNLMEARFTVSTNATGDIEVSQTVQAQFVPIYGYQNMIYSNVGAPLELEKRTFKPDELVAVKKGNGMEFILAKDLAAYKSNQQIAHYGEKVLMTVTDLAMLAAGQPELAIGLRGLRIAAAAGRPATATEIRSTIMGGLNTGLALTAPINNAYFNASETGRTLNEVRNLLFVGTAGYGLGRMAFGQTARGAAGMETEAREIAALTSQNSRTSQNVDRWAQGIMHASQVPMIPIMGSGIVDQVKEIWNHRSALAVMDARIALQTEWQRNNNNTDAAVGNSRIESHGSDTAAVVRFKKLLLEGNNGDASGNLQITQIFDRLAQAVSPEATPEQREALRRELSANLVFTTKEMELLRTANGRSLSPEQYSALLSNETRDKADVHAMTKLLAARFMASKNENVIEASQIALLILAEKTGNPTANTLATATIDALRPSPNRERMSASPADNQPITFDISTSAVIRNLQNTLPSIASNGRGEVIANVLLRAGAISPQQYGAVLQNILQNDSIKPDDKMRAMLGSSGANLAAVVSGMIDQEQKVLRDQSLTQAQRDAFRAENFGTTSKDFIQAFARVAMEDGNADIRAMAAALNFSLKRLQEDPKEGIELLNQMIAVREATFDNGQPGFAETVISGLTGVVKDDAEPAQARIAAAQSLLQLTNKMPAAQAAEINSAVNADIAKIAVSANAQDLTRVLDFLGADRMNALRVVEPALVSQITDRALSLISTPNQYDAALEKQMISVINQMPVLLGDANSESRNSFINKAESILSQSHSLHSDLRVAVIKALDSMNEPKNISLIKNLAESDRYASVRLAALRLLEKRDDQLASVLPRLLERETDITVSRTLSDMLQRSRNDGSLDQSAAAQEIERFFSADAGRYPGLNGFDSAAQQEWLKNNFPLLDRETFVSTAQREGRRQRESFMGRNHTEAAERVQERKHQQFQLLVELAQGSGNDVQTQKARQVLANLIATNAQSFDFSNTRIEVGHSVTHDPRGTILDVNVVYFNEKSRNWSKEAAEALAEASKAGNTGRDLTARLLAQALVSTSNPETREVLKKAWERLNTATDGTSVVPLRVRQLVSRFAS